MNPYRVFAAATLGVLASGCVTKPIAYEMAVDVPQERYSYVAPQSDNLGTVRVTRDTGFAGSGCLMVISIGGIEAARLESGERASFPLREGEHVFSVAPSERGLCGVQRDRVTRRAEVNVRAGQLKRYRAGINPNAGPFFDPAE